MQASFDVLFKAGIELKGPVGDPGAHGAAAVFGTQGIGVKTPAAADVAVAVAGNAGQLQTPNGLIFSIGLLSMMFPASCMPDLICFGVAENTDGAAPKVHCSTAVVTTCFAIEPLPSLRF